MPIPPTLEIVDLSNGSVVHVFRIPVGVIGEPAASSFVLGRKELIDWFGPFEGSDKVSRKHLRIDAADCVHGMVGDFSIKDAQSVNGSVPEELDSEDIPGYNADEPACPCLEIRLAGVVSVGVRWRDPEKGLLDIGHFGTHDESPGIRHLRDSGGIDPESAARLIEVLGASLDSSFTHIDRELLDSDARLNLISYTESKFDGTPDFKEYLSNDALIELVGRHRFEELSRLMDNDFSEIVLRRVEDHGMAINFHTDYARRTMQVILSDESDYSGCDLVYVTGKGFQQPRRRAGTATIHDNTILHGVTEMESGVRYSLFFLRNDSILQRAAH